ncbi:MAG: Na+/H+ antiporter subunit E [Opitutaceae bacterium]|nr:Na+/H+ antiporter subunit E [Opitutaceae bacterium]
MIGFVLNLGLALIWFFLGDEPDGARLFVGWVLGFSLVWLFRGVLGGDHYTRRAVALVVFLAVFHRELLLSNLQLARTVLFARNRTLRPEIFLYPVAGLTKAEILLLSHCITLTPGTSTIDIEDDFTQLRLHALDGSDLPALSAGIKRNLEARILAFTR